jgi:tRNA U34 2-thiouridine synthase MnmA/TrmU
VKIRYRGARLAGALEGDGSAERRAPTAGEHERLRVRLAKAAERTAAGQLACFYDGDLLVGYGTIDARV